MKTQEIKSSNQLQTQYQLSSTVELVKYEDTTVLSDWARGKFFGLYPLTAKLLKGLIDGQIKETIDEVYILYDVPREQVEKDTQAFAKDLLKNKIIIEAQNLKNFSLPSPLSICLLLILARISYKILGLLPSIRLWRCFHNPIHCELPENEREELIEILSIRIQEQCSKIPFAVDCKERALVGYTVLRAMGLPAELVLAAQYYPFAMHAWSECFGIVVGDNAKRCSYWIPVKKFS